MTVTSRWHKQRATATATATDNEYAQQCITDLRAAHWFVLHTDLLAQLPTRGGMHFEWGYAHCRGMLCVVIGEAAPIYAQLPDNLTYPNWEAFVQFLKG